MPRMKIIVRFFPSITDFLTGKLGKTQPGQKPPKIFFISLVCPACRKTFMYDGKRTMDCPECAKREGELAGINGVGELLARKGRG